MHREVVHQLLALRQAGDHAASQSGGTSGQRSSSSLKSSDSGGGEPSVDVDTTVINSLVCDPEVALTHRTVPTRQAAVYVSHRVHVEAGVFDEGVPLIRVRLPRRPAQLDVLGPGLREKLYQLLARLVFSLVLRDFEHVAEHSERAGQAVLQRDHHGVCNFIHRNIYAAMTQHGAVKVAVVDYNFVSPVDHGLQGFAPVRHVLRVPHSHLVLVPRPWHQHDLCRLGIGMGAVRDRHGAEGFGI